MAEAWVSTARSVHLRGRRVRDTEPELLLRRALHRVGARFRLQRAVAPGVTADLVLPRHRLAVFVDGDFWHGCPAHGVTEFRGPNAELWRRKIERTKARDARGTEAGRCAGWVVIRLWECEVLADPDAAARRVLAAAPQRPIDPPARSS